MNHERTATARTGRIASKAGRTLSIFALVCGTIAAVAPPAHATHTLGGAFLDCVNDQVAPPAVSDSTFFAGIYAIPYFYVIYPDSSTHAMWGDYFIAEYESAYGFPNLYAWGVFPSAASVSYYGLPRSVPVGSTYAVAWAVWSMADSKAGSPAWQYVWATNSAGGYYCSNAFQ